MGGGGGDRGRRLRHRPAANRGIRPTVRRGNRGARLRNSVATRDPPRQLASGSAAATHSAGGRARCRRDPGIRTVDRNGRHSAGKTLPAGGGGSGRGPLRDGWPRSRSRRRSRRDRLSRCDYSQPDCSRDPAGPVHRRVGKAPGSAWPRHRVRVHPRLPAGRRGPPGQLAGDAALGPAR